MMLIRPSFGYSKVQLMNGQQGYVASPGHSRRATTVGFRRRQRRSVPSASHGTEPDQEFRFDPRSIPAEPLPNDAPEPTPIPETEASPSP